MDKPSNTVRFVFQERQELTKKPQAKEYQPSFTFPGFGDTLKRSLSRSCSDTALYPWSLGHPDDGLIGNTPHNDTLHEDDSLRYNWILETCNDSVQLEEENDS